MQNGSENPVAKPTTVMFDLLTGLIDSWTLWNTIAGGEVAGRRWRAEYLRLTYGQGGYRPYTEIVADAAETAGLPRSLAADLDARWPQLAAWPEARVTLQALRRHGLQLAVATNCSERLGRAAADAVGVDFDVVVTAERAGAYKPLAAPYALALDELSMPPERVLFLAGSPSDIAGAHGVGMDVVWHNRVGLPRPADCAGLIAEIRSLEPLLRLATSPFS